MSELRPGGRVVAVTEVLRPEQGFLWCVRLDARLLLLANRLLPARVVHRLFAMALGLPKPGSLRGTTPPHPIDPA